MSGHALPTDVPTPGSGLPALGALFGAGGIPGISSSSSAASMLEGGTLQFGSYAGSSVSGASAGFGTAFGGQASSAGSLPWLLAAAILAAAIIMRR